MSKKVVNLPSIGEVWLVKRRGTKNLRLSIQADGKVRIGMPIWAPYSTAIAFALSRAAWIKQNRQELKQPLLKNGHRIGKSYRLMLISQPSSRRTYATLRTNTITVTSPLNVVDKEFQAHATKACEKALKLEASHLLDARVREIANKNHLEYKGLKIKRLTSRWGSCSHEGIITLNYFLIQLPWPLIDYVIIHELAHTEYLNHSSKFWGLVEQMLPNAKSLRKQIKSYRPVLLPT